MLNVHIIEHLSYGALLTKGWTLKVETTLHNSNESKYQMCVPILLGSNLPNYRNYWGVRYILCSSLGQENKSISRWMVRWSVLTFTYKIHKHTNHTQFSSKLVWKQQKKITLWNNCIPVSFFEENYLASKI